MLLMFELTMPNIGSWNGRWSGEGKRYIRFKDVPMQKIEQILNGETDKSFHYNFGDGWSANIKVSESSSMLKRYHSRHLKNGFYGYEWMIDSILENGQIICKTVETT